MPSVIFVKRDGSEVKVEAAVGRSVMEVGRDSGVGIEGTCGGSLSCATCHVVVDSAWVEATGVASEDEEDMLDLAFGLEERSRLGCQIKMSDVRDGLRVRLPNDASAGRRAGARRRGGELNALGFACPPSETRVVVAMSGGVDSSVVAALLVEEGFDVVGITLQLYDHGAAIKSKGACCAGSDIVDARMVAGRLGIKHYVLDYESRFRSEVMDDFADAYLRGETPIPCVRCNQSVKFVDLLRMSRDLGASCLATGHYVRREVMDGRVVLKRGLDARKDQSYFLFSTTREQLDYLRFPLGGFDKETTRGHARRFGLSVHDKVDSQDICFVPGGGYGDVVRRLRPGAVDSGDIVYRDGTVLGRHDGIIDYTIGQRRGLGIGGRTGSDEPLYVIGIDADSRRVIVGEKAFLACDRVHIGDVNWLGSYEPCVGGRVGVRVRHSSGILGGCFVGFGGGRAEVLLDAAEYGIACGQAGVFYDDLEPDVVLGGGWIVSAPRLGCDLA